MLSQSTHQQSNTKASAHGICAEAHVIVVWRQLGVLLVSAGRAGRIQVGGLGVRVRLAHAELHEQVRVTEVGGLAGCPVNGEVFQSGVRW